MRSINVDTGRKKDPKKKSDSKFRLFSDKSLYASVNSEKSKNYMEGDDNVNGPHLDTESKNVDGDSTVNAGVFK